MKTPKIPISIVVITDKSPGEMRQCLSSAEFAEEIIIYKVENIHDFSQARNEALRKAGQEWVFFLDSDERITPDSVQVIKQIIDDGVLDGVLIQRHDFFHQKMLHWGETRNVWMLRMFRTNNGHFVRPVHEVAVVKGVVKTAPITIHHFSHLNISSFLQSVSSYARIEANFRRQQAKGKTRKLVVFLEMLFFPSAKFFMNFVVKLGFLDGWRGLVYALMMSLHSLLVRVYLYENT